jgi:predicted helicase
LKLSQFLNDRGHPLKHKERLQVLLTNTLEPIDPQPNLMVEAISAEVKEAQKVKEKAILVITGNPPYSGHSKNKGPWITAQIAKYREGFPELSKPAQGKWLQDDYVKFMRFAQMKIDGGDFEYKDENGNLQTIHMEGVERGLVGIVTNHSYLDNPTFKGMRKSLVESFDQIYVFDLHGSVKKRGNAPTGIEDQNVFDIEQGVSISLFVKNPNSERGVWHAEVWGKRLHKYHVTASERMSTIAWSNITPREPHWFFKPYDLKGAAAYDIFWSMRDIFRPMGDPAPGFVTTHDEFAISFTSNEAQSKVQQLIKTDTESQARKLFRLCSQEQWSYTRAKAELPTKDLSTITREIAYRPFDTRWTIWDRNVAVHRRERITQYMNSGNIAIDVCRVVSSGNWQHALAVARAPEDSFISNRTKERGFVFPIYLAGVENLGQEFRKYIDSRYHHHYTPEEIFGYIYAVLHTPLYRALYAEFLCMDFPRIPFPEDSADFDALSQLGWQLVQAHLLREFPRKNLADFHGKGDYTVESVRYSEQEKAIWINETQCFKPVPEEVWNFHIGGYQVLDKYLKSRKTRTLTLDEINHVSAVADSLAFTIAQMQKIDKAYRKAFQSVDK